MNARGDRTTSLLHAPPPSWGDIFSSAMVSGGVGAGIMAFVLPLMIGVWSVAMKESPRLLSLMAIGGWGALTGFCLGFSVGFLRRSRAALSHAFTATGFLATFFGLFMLAVFFGGLFLDVSLWFYWTPILVEKANKETVILREELKKTEELRAARKAEIDKEFKETLESAANAEEKAEISKLFLGFPEKLKELEAQELDQLAKAKSDDQRRFIRERFDLEIRAVGGVYAENLRVYDANLADQRRIADLPLRDTSRWSVFTHFLFGAPSDKPEAVGIKPALFGSLWLALIMILFAVPVGVGAALYLEEYNKKSFLANLIQTNINNLAGVPSIVYGILGAWVFVEMIFKPIHLLNEGISVRNVFGAGVTLGLLTLPVVIVSSQEAIRAVPQSIRHGSYALGATRWQTIWQLVLPLARPGIMTGTILAVSRAIGEAAPLVLFGATTFIAFTPDLFSEFTVLPIQIFNWAERPTNPIIDGKVVRAWNFNMAMASLVLMTMLLMLNALAIYLRNRAQKAVRW